MPTPDVSVLLPVCNGIAYVADTVRSVVRQRGVAVELVVVDDGSIDGSAAAVMAAAKGTVPVVMLRNESPSGHPAGPRNQAAAAATAPWLALVDQDDRWRPSKLRRQLQLLAQRSADVCYSRATVEGAGRRRDYHEWCCPSVGAGALPEGDLRAALSVENVIPALTSVVSRDAWRRACGVDERRIGVDDYDLWLRLAGSGAQFCAVQRSTAVYRWHRDNLSATRGLEQRAALDEMWRDLR